MTDTTATYSTPPKKKRGLLVPVIVAILAIAIIGFIASRAGLDKALVKQQLDNFIAQLKERGKSQGRDIDVTYGELEVVGSFASKHVVIHDPKLSIKPSERQPDAPGQQKKIDSLVITTPTMAVYPESADLSDIRIELPDPLNFASEDAPEKSLLKVTNNVPVIVKVAKTTRDNVPYTDVKYESPSQIELVYLREEQGQGAEDKTPEVVPVYDTINISTAQGSGMTSKTAGDNSGLGEADVNYKDITITPRSAPKGALKIAEITAHWKNALNEQKLNVLSTTAKVGPITSDNVNAPYLPVSFDMDASYEGAQPKTPEAIAASKSQVSRMNLKAFNLKTKDAALTATANFTANAGDVLPVGNANIALTNVPYVLAEVKKRGLVTDNNFALLGTVLQLVTGTPIEQLKDANIAIERPKGGQFKIGQTTFEELFAVFLKQAMQQKAAAGEAAPVIMPNGATVTPLAPGAVAPAAPHVPQLPPADKPKSAPISMPDHGVRG